MDTFVDSSWYFLRYVDPHNDQAPFDREIVDYWCPIDQYIGGIDHATGHLLYSRFFVKVMNEMGLVGFREPFSTVFHQGWVQMGGTKMSKTKGNVVGPGRLRRRARRRRRAPLHPLPRPRRPGHGVDGFGYRGHRALPAAAVAARARGRGRRGEGDAGADTPLARKAHETIAKVTDDIERRHSYNTAISAIMELVNELSRRHVGSGGAVRRRDGGVADPAVRAAHRRGAVGRARAREAVGRCRGRSRTRRCSSARRSSSSSR